MLEIDTGTHDLNRLFRKVKKKIGRKEFDLATRTMTPQEKITFLKQYCPEGKIFRSNIPQEGTPTLPN